jgi:hypothetical protein
VNPRVKQVTTSDDYKLYLLFENGQRGVFDCSQHLSFGVFKELRDLAYFKRVKVLDGTVVWPNHQDICPDTLFLESVKEK